MGKGRSKSGTSFAGTIVLALAAIILFGIGEALILTRTDAGRLTASRYLKLGDSARVNEIVGRHARAALEAAGVPRDSIRERVDERARPRLVWRVGLKPLSSTLQINYALTTELEHLGAAVLSGREGVGRHGEFIVTLVVGMPGRPTHEIQLVRPGVSLEASRTSDAEGHLALLLYGLGDDAARARRIVEMSLPFAVAIPPAQPWSSSAFRDAHEHGREVVLHLPLEPINYPQVTPGPGAILVTMSSSKISGLVQRYVDQGRPVVAVSNLLGSLATQDQTVMTAVLKVLKQRRIPFLHMDAVAGSVARSIASDVGAAYEEPDIVLDLEARHEASLDRRWRDALDLSRRRGQAIVCIRATDTVLQWLPRALSKERLHGVEIVPITSLVRLPVGA
jgi:polysaccharide deacetylase 2 family uncharacterized protein YibQ